MERGSKPAGTRYVFAGTSDGEKQQATKVCPRCGEVLFADMDVCYGCLYDFARDARDAREAPGPVGGTSHGVRSQVGSQEVVRSSASSTRSDPLEAIDLDELDDEVLETEPRHWRAQASADDTLDLSQEGPGVPPPAPTALQAARPCIRVATKELEVLIPLGDAGLAVGRGDDNDVILRSRLVSRHHLRILCSGGEVMVQDCGATNPAEVDGQPLEGQVPLLRGSELKVCGVTFSREG